MVDRKKMLARVRGWILCGNEACGGPCKAIGLFHLPTQSAVENWLIDELTDPDGIVNELIGAAERDAAGIGGLQQFMVCAYFGDSRHGSNSWGSRFLFCVEASSHSSSTTACQRASSMSWLQEQMRVALIEQAELSKKNADLNKRIENLLARAQKEVRHG